MVGSARRLLEHLTWADERVLKALQATSAPPVPALKLYAHLVAAEHVWLSRLRGEPPALPVWPTLNLDECATLAAQNAAGLEAFARRLGTDELRAEVAYRTSAGDAYRSTTEEILLHLALHGSYHRGQIALLVREAGLEPSATDFIVFARTAPPEPPTPG